MHEQIHVCTNYTYTCTCVQCIHARVYNVHMYMYKYTCTCVQCIHVHVYNVYMYMCTMHTCTCVQCIHVHVYNVYMQFGGKISFV